MPRQTSQGSWKSLTSHSKASSKHTTHLPALFLLPQERLWEIPTFFLCCLAPDKAPGSASCLLSSEGACRSGRSFCKLCPGRGRSSAALASLHSQGHDSRDLQQGQSKDGQGKGRGMTPVKAELQAGQWDQDQLHSTHPYLKQPHPDLLSGTTDPGHGCLAWGAQGPLSVPPRGNRLTWSHSTSKIPVLSQAVKGFAKSPRVAASLGAGG